MYSSFKMLSEGFYKNVGMRLLQKNRIITNIDICSLRNSMLIRLKIFFFLSF